uniref:Putative LOV domain-containing protein n=1 Tax=Vittaria appalachiana TaxID=57323 RepID=A0A126WZR3_9MONI|nr:putative LOV domain-containing protein [Vittaria appalachiana]
MGMEPPQSCGRVKANTSSIAAAEEQEAPRDDEGVGVTETKRSSIKAQLCTAHTISGGHQVENSSVTKSCTVAGSSKRDMAMASLMAVYEDSLGDALRRAQFNFVLTDPRIKDNPIVFASDGFLTMAGYTAEEVMGKNCRFLQGPATDRRTIIQIRDAIREERPCQVSILNYTKQGKPFWNLFHMAPVYSREDGRVVHYVGVQTPIYSSAHQQSSVSSLECICDSASEKLVSFASSMDIPQHTISSTILEEDHCETGEYDKDRAKTCVSTLFSELASKCKGAGVTETRCLNISAGPCAERVICSSLMLSLTKVQQSFVLANPHLPDVPIVHASELFLQLTGYQHDEVVGRNCRFLQGPDTDPKAIELIRESLRAEKPCTVRILNYRRDKTPFWNLLHIAPVRSNSGKVVFFVGVQLDVNSVEDVYRGKETGPHFKQLGAVGAVRVAVRSLQGEGLRRIRKC